MILTTAAVCLAANIFFEARNEPERGQLAVASVTMNRAGHDPTKVCQVVLKRKQFSWTTQHVAYRGGVPHVRNWAKLMQVEEPVWKKSLALAKTVLAGQIVDYSRGATYYHASYVAPYWRKAYVQTAQIGRHVFYREIKSSVTII